MARSLRLRLTDAQVSALECGDWSEEPHLEAAWDRGQWLTWDHEQTEGLASDLTAGSNSEDAMAEDRGRGAEERLGARGAARALANLAGKVLSEHDRLPEGGR